ncbi:hypothetical protein JOB18_042371 [Solea senegalensis]|nr:hypothetical protein JOB18_035026 [Solea senegalensis]KAG7464266.1 hypothetical protein JOB18_013207 [Solea senegalensis]KAG7471734.1 hypothetical protein JOB18_042371 [Solea senegalensis]
MKKLGIQLLLAKLKETRPALFSEAQLYSEFHRITNPYLPLSFYTALDKYAPQLLKLEQKRKTGSFGEKMEDVLMAYEDHLHYIAVECEE